MSQTDVAPSPERLRVPPDLEHTPVVRGALATLASRGGLHVLPLVVAAAVLATLAVVADMAAARLFPVVLHDGELIALTSAGDVPGTVALVLGCVLLVAASGVVTLTSVADGLERIPTLGGALRVVAGRWAFVLAWSAVLAVGVGLAVVALRVGSAVGPVGPPVASVLLAAGLVVVAPWGLVPVVALAHDRGWSDAWARRRALASDAGPAGRAARRAPRVVVLVAMVVDAVGLWAIGRVASLVDVDLVPALTWALAVVLTALVVAGATVGMVRAYLRVVAIEQRSSPDLGPRRWTGVDAVARVAEPGAVDRTSPLGWLVVVVALVAVPALPVALAVTAPLPVAEVDVMPLPPGWDSRPVQVFATGDGVVELVDTGPGGGTLRHAECRDGMAVCADLTAPLVEGSWVPIDVGVDGTGVVVLAQGPGEAVLMMCSVGACEDDDVLTSVPLGPAIDGLGDGMARRLAAVDASPGGYAALVPRPQGAEAPDMTSLDLVRCADAECVDLQTVDLGRLGEGSVADVRVADDGTVAVLVADTASGTITLSVLEPGASAVRMIGGVPFVYLVAGQAGALGPLVTLELGPDDVPLALYRDESDGRLSQVLCPDTACELGFPSPLPVPVDETANAHVTLDAQGLPLVVTSAGDEVVVHACTDARCLTAERRVLAGGWIPGEFDGAPTRGGSGLWVDAQGRPMVVVHGRGWFEGPHLLRCVDTRCGM